MGRLAKVVYAIAALAAFLAVAASPASAAYIERGVFASGGPGEGGSGSEDGYLFNPGQADVNDATGKLYVADTGNNRIEVFAPAPNGGTYDSQLAFTEPTGLAIDQSNGDVYVSSAAGIAKLTSSLAPVPGWSNPGVTGNLAVDPSTGDLLVADTGSAMVRRFESDGTAAAGISAPRPIDVAANSAGEVFVVTSTGDVITDCQATSTVVRYSAAGVELGTVGASLPTPGAVAVDPDDDSIAIASRVNQWSCGFDAPQVTFLDSTGALRETMQVGINSWAMVPGLTLQGGGSGRIYVLTKSPMNDIFGGTAIYLFEEVDAQEVTIDPVDPATVTATEATLSGSVDPNGNDATWWFEYRRSGTEDWQSTSKQDAGSGEDPVTVSAVAQGLQPNSSYQGRLASSSSVATERSAAVEFETDLAPPGAETLVAAPVEAASAWLRGRINPFGQASTYHFQWGTTAAYGNRAPAADAGAGSGDEPLVVSAPAHGLQPSTTYHFRVVATNATGTTFGDDLTFTTPAAASCANEAIRQQQQARHLPDCRAYEQVSPVDKSGNSVGGSNMPALRLSVSADGDRVTYDSVFAYPISETGGWSGYLSSRGTGGWSTIGLPKMHGKNAIGAGGPTANDTLLRGTTPDQRTSVYWDCTTEPYGALWIRRADGSRQQIAPATSFQPDGCRDALDTKAEQPWFLGISDDGTRVVFRSRSRLGPAAGLPGSGRILYEWEDDGGNGTLRVVNRTNDPSLALLNEGDATLGGVAGEFGRPPLVGRAKTFEAVRNAISNGSDGHSRIYFQAPGPADPSQGGGALYLRLDGTETVEVSAPEDGHTPVSPVTATGVRYIDASRDGTRAFFYADGDLTAEAPPAGGVYAYDASAGSLEWLADALLGGGTTGVADDDGSHLYYQAGEDVRLLVDDEVRMVCAGCTITGDGQAGEEGAPGFPPLPGIRTTSCASADPSPDGRYLAFSARRDGIGLSNPQIYRYDAFGGDGSGSLTQVSTSLTGPPPTQYSSGFSAMCAHSAGPGRPTEVRAMSDDGSRIFFDTGAPLVPQDSNGLRMDAYGWNQGRVSLISSGSSTLVSSFVGTDVGGDSAFFLTSQRLAFSDGDEAFDIYAARVNGGFAAPPPRSDCEGESCQPPAGPPPRSQAPGSAALQGPVNERPRRSAKKAKKKAGKHKKGKPKKGKHKKAGKRTKAGKPKQGMRRHGKQQASGRVN